MTQLLEFELDDGTKVLVESATTEVASKRRLERSDEEIPVEAIEKAAKISLEATFSVVRPTAERLVSVLQNISGPEELGVEFGLGFSAKQEFSSPRLIATSHSRFR
jgi:hypothetical protein